MKKADVVIIGTGVIGSSLALSLLEKNKDINVLIIGNKDKAGNATQAAGAMLGCYGEVTETLLKSKYGQAKLRCSIEAKNLWEDWVALVNERSKKNVKINKGTYIIHNMHSGNIDTKNYRAIKKTLRDNNEAFEESYFENIPGINTLENQRSLDAIYIPNEGSLCAPLFLESLHEALKTYKNCHLLNEEIVQINSTDEKVKSITLSNGETIDTAILVLAAGAFTQKLIDQLPSLEKKIPRILAGVGHSIILSNNRAEIKHVIRTPNRAGACGLHILPYGNDEIYVGATNELKITPESTPTAGWVHFLLQCLFDQVNQNFFSKKIAKICVGNRPSPIDGFPLLGYTSISNLFLLTGTYRDGFHQSPYLAKIAAENILHNTPMMDNLFNAERTPIQTMSRDEAIQESIEHHMASGYEAGAKFPYAFWSESLKNYIKADVEAFYNTINAKMNFLPEQTLMLRDHKDDPHLNEFLKNYFINTNF